VYNVDDCLDGIEFIISHAQEDLQKHSSVFKESYQLFTSYIKELDVATNKLLNFPFHQLMDIQLSDIPYQFSKNDLPSISKIILGLPSVNLITTPRLALKQYEVVQTALNKLHPFMDKLREQLKKTYFSKTNVNLLTLSPKLYKRHLVMDLYS
jgi:hypothetical protein